MFIDAIQQMHNETMLGWLALTSIFIGIIVLIGQYAISVREHWDKMSPMESGKPYLVTVVCMVCGCIPAILKIYTILA